MAEGPLELLVKLFFNYVKSVDYSYTVSAFIDVYTDDLNCGNLIFVLLLKWGVARVSHKIVVTQKCNHQYRD